MKTFPSPEALRRFPFGMADLALLLGTFLLLALGAGALVSFAPPQVVPQIDLDPRNLPYYAGRSTLRMFIALFFSTLFTLVYGYTAANNRWAERVMIPLLDILQSVPVLGFLSITVTGFIALFPGSLLGLEAASIFTIFTSQVWNMTFSFYQSLRTVPVELQEAATLYQLSRWQRFTTLEVPAAVIGLLWNAMMSFGGGWFFVVASEAISVLNQSYTLPGIGSYVAAAIADENLVALGWAFLTIAIVILLVDQLFWRPLIAWSDKFRMEQSASAAAPESWVYNLLQTARIPRRLGNFLTPATEALNRLLSRLSPPRSGFRVTGATESQLDRLYTLILLLMIGVLIASALHWIMTTVGLGEVFKTFGLGILTLLRVTLLLLFATVIWTPIGVAIGFNPKLARTLQPVVQFLASFPANFIFPFATLFFLWSHLSLEWGSIPLMALVNPNPFNSGPLIVVEQVSKRFLLPDGKGEFTVLKDVSLTVKSGEVIALLGRSGSGKSTLLRIMAGLIPPSEGQVYSNGQPLRGANNTVAMVFQSFALLPWLTVQENVELGLEARGVKREERRQRALQAIAVGVGRHYWHPSAVADEIRLSGRIEGYETDLAAKVGGRVVQMGVAEGDRVESGEVVAQFEDAQIQAQLAQAQAQVGAAQQQVNQAQLQVAVLTSQMEEAHLTLQQSQGDSQGRLAQATAAVAQAQLGEAQAALDLARADRGRFADLVDRGAIPQQQFDQVETRLQSAQKTLVARRAALSAAQQQVTAAQGALTQAQSGGLTPDIRQAQINRLTTQQQQARAQLAASQATLKQAQAAAQEVSARLADLTITSPIAGVVVTRTAEPGEVVAAGAALVTVVDLGSVYLRGYIPEAQVGLVRVGQAAQVFLDSAPDQPLAATVAAVDAEASFTPENIYFKEDRITQVFGLKLALTNPQGFAKPGMPADGKILLTPAPVRP